MATRYAQSIAIEQIPFQNFPGGGPIAGPSNGSFAADFNDAGLEIGNVLQVTSIYQMYGNEVANDVINIYLAQPGTIVDPTYSSIAGSGVGGTATINVGDDDTLGYGLVSSGAAFGQVQLDSSITKQGADPSRYASGVNVATGQTNPIAFAGGSSLADPHVIGLLATEQSLSGGGGTGAGVSGSWIQAQFATLATVVPGKVLVFRLKVIKP